MDVEVLSVLVLFGFVQCLDLAGVVLHGKRRHAPHAR